MLAAVCVRPVVTIKATASVLDRGNELEPIRMGVGVYADSVTVEEGDAPEIGAARRATVQGSVGEAKIGHAVSPRAQESGASIAKRARHHEHS